MPYTFVFNYTSQMFQYFYNGSTGGFDWYNRRRWKHKGEVIFVHDEWLDSKISEVPKLIMNI